MLVWSCKSNVRRRIRRIRCDETKPVCLKCSSTGRKCDGYGDNAPATTTNHANKSQLANALSTHVTGSKAERRGFDFFLSRTATEMSGYYEQSFWGRLLLAAATQHDSIRHAVIAISALHEDFTQALSKSSSSSPSQPANFASKQYTKSVSSLRKSLATGKEDTLTALMSCILLVSFDSLHGNYEAALVHLRGGLKVLHDHHRSRKRDHIIEEYIAPLFHRLTCQSLIYIEAKDQSYLKDFAEVLLEGAALEEGVSVPDFRTLHDARNSLYRSASGLLGAFFSWE